MSKLLPSVAYVVGTLLTALGWLCALAQGDAPQDDPRPAAIIVIFTLALALLAIPASSLRRAKRWTKYVQVCLIGLQAAFCVYVIVAEFAL
jgi:hypothetical protein